MRFEVQLRDVVTGPRHVVVDTETDRVVAFTETVEEAEYAASVFERRAA